MDKKEEQTGRVGTARDLLARLDQILEGSKRKEVDDVKLELERFAPSLSLTSAQSTIKKLIREKQVLEQENAELQKTLEDSNRQAECREQMAEFYYSSEIDALNDTLRSLVQKNNVFSHPHFGKAMNTVLQSKEAIISHMAEVLHDILEAADDDQALSRSEQVGDRKPSFDDKKDSPCTSSESQIIQIRNGLESLLKRQFEMSEEISSLRKQLARQQTISGDSSEQKWQSKENAAKIIHDTGMPESYMPIRWIPDDFSKRCMGCGAGFGCIFSKRDHCRMCGGLFCSNCVLERDFVPPFYVLDKVPVCSACFNSVGAKLKFE